MKKASSILDKLKDINNEYMQERKNLLALQSKLDKEVSRLYHDLESRGNLNAAEGYYVARDLQAILRKRRIVKQEIYELNAVSNPVNLQQLSTNLKKVENGMSKIKKDTKNNYWRDWDLNVSDFESEYIN